MSGAARETVASIAIPTATRLDSRSGTSPLSTRTLTAAAAAATTGCPARARQTCLRAQIRHRQSEGGDKIRQQEPAFELSRQLRTI